jgi:hypothetical protein
MNARYDSIMNSIASSALPAIVGAFAIWLTGYFINQPAKARKMLIKRATLGFAFALAGLGVYVLSFGPVVWACARISGFPDGGIISEVLHTVYIPLGNMTLRGPKAVTRTVTQYARLGATTKFPVHVPIQDGNWASIFPETEMSGIIDPAKPAIGFWLTVVVAALLAAYMSAYALTVSPHPIVCVHEESGVRGRHRFPLSPRYVEPPVVGQSGVRVFFAPIHWADRKLRSNAWHRDLEF